MTTAPAPQATQAINATKALGPTLAQEAGELDALHTGLVRHLTVWRDAHEAAIFRLGAVMARMDAILERVERSRNQGCRNQG
jgi:hypothetical protein